LGIIGFTGIIYIGVVGIGVIGVGIIGVNVVGVSIVSDKVAYLLRWFSKHAIARIFIIRPLRRLIFKGMYRLYSKSAAF
jgi:hypothetical protein